MRTRAIVLLPVFFFSANLHAEPLHLSEAVREAIQKSPEVGQASQELRIASYEEPALLALTDPKINLRGEVEEDRAPRSAPAIQGSFTKTRRVDANLTQNWLIGTEASIFFNSL